MAGNEDEAKAGKPAFDPNKLLADIEALLMKKSVKVEDGFSPGRVSTKWYWAIIAPVLVLVAVAAFTWWSQRANRELAKLRHEKVKAKIIKEQTELFVELNKNDIKVAEAQKLIDASNNKLRIIEADIAAEEKKYEANLDALHRIHTWDGTYRRKGG